MTYNEVYEKYQKLVRLADAAVREARRSKMTREKVLAIITEASGIPRGLRKSDILDELRLDDTKENRKELTGIIRKLKEEGIIDSYCLVSPEGGQFCGRGYALAE